jgi:hypothetical protein
VVIPRVSTAVIVAAAGALFLLWTPVLPRWVRRPRWVTVRFVAGGSADETPRAVVIGGEEEPVRVVSASRELVSAGGESVQRRRFVLRTPEGAIMEITGGDQDRRWRLVRDVPADIAGGHPAD